MTSDSDTWTEARHTSGRRVIHANRGGVCVCVSNRRWCFQNSQEIPSAHMHIFARAYMRCAPMRPLFKRDFLNNGQIVSEQRPLSVLKVSLLCHHGVLRILCDNLVSPEPLPLGRSLEYLRGRLMCSNECALQEGYFQRLGGLLSKRPDTNPSINTTPSVKMNCQKVSATFLRRNLRPLKESESRKTQRCNFSMDHFCK